MPSERFDVIVIGAGAGGSTAGAILAAREGMKVLVLEKAPRIGGRDISFEGGREDPDVYLSLLAEAAHTRYVKSEPPLEELFRSGILEGFCFEAGIHVLPMTEKGRTATCLSFLGKSLDLHPALSAGWWHKGNLYRFEQGSEKGGQFSWMDDEGRREVGRINRLMVKMSAREAHALDHVSLQEWMEGQTANEAAKEFHYVNATMNCTLNYPWTISAGDNILMNRAVARAGKRFSFGGCSTVGAPGFGQVPGKFCEVIRDNGGTVLTGAPVKEVLIEGGKVKGVLAEIDGMLERIDCPIVVSSDSVQEMFDYLPERHFPVSFVRRVRGFWRAGAGLVYFGLSREVISEHLTFVPAVAGREDGFEGDVRMGFWASSSMDPSRAPRGSQLVDAYVSLTDRETRNPALVETAYWKMKNFLEDRYPGFRRALVWSLYTVTDSLIPVAQAPGQVGDARPRAKCPWVEGLYFASDTTECSMAANDAAVHAGILAASRVSGRDYVREILPEYLQE